MDYQNMNIRVLKARKDVISSVIAEFPGGRMKAAETLGLSLKQFDNRAYENNNSRPLSELQLRQLEHVAGTTHLAEYVASLYGGLFVRIAQPEQLDAIELYGMAMQVSTRRGAVDQEISKALEDGVVTSTEAAKIMHLHNQHIAARHTEVLAAIDLHRPHNEVAP